MIVVTHRIVKRERSATCFDGEGARLFGGRWNSKGGRMVYTSATQSLAILETLVHLDSHEALAKLYCTRSAQFEHDLIESIDTANLPTGWDADIPLNATREIGDRWLRESRSAVLAVPSVISSSELNYLLNPSHPDFSKIVLGPEQDFVFSQRLLKK